MYSCMNDKDLGLVSAQKKVNKESDFENKLIYPLISVYFACSTILMVMHEKVFLFLFVLQLLACGETI